MLFWGWGKRVKQAQVTDQGQPKIVVLQYSYFSLMFILSFTWGEKWYLMSDKRSEDRRLTQEEVVAFFQPNKPPEVHPWEKYSLLAVIAGFALLIFVGPIISDFLRAL